MCSQHWSFCRLGDWEEPSAVKRSRKQHIKNHQMKRLLCLSELLCVLRPSGVSVFLREEPSNPPTASQSQRKQTRTQVSSPGPCLSAHFAKHAQVILLHCTYPDTTYKCFSLRIPLPCSPLHASAVCNWAMIFLQGSNKRWLTTYNRKKKTKQKERKRKESMLMRPAHTVLIWHFQTKGKYMAVHKSSKYTIYVTAAFVFVTVSV